MKNIAIELKGNIVTITLDISQTYGKSSSGKSIIVASTEGNVTIPGTDVKLGLNAYQKEA